MVAITDRPAETKTGNEPVADATDHSSSRGNLGTPVAREELQKNIAASEVETAQVMEVQNRLRSGDPRFQVLSDSIDGLDNLIEEAHLREQDTDGYHRSQESARRRFDEALESEARGTVYERSGSLEQAQESYNRAALLSEAASLHIDQVELEKFRQDHLERGRSAVVAAQEDILRQEENLKEMGVFDRIVGNRKTQQGILEDAKETLDERREALDKVEAAYAQMNEQMHLSAALREEALELSKSGEMEKAAQKMAESRELMKSITETAEKNGFEMDYTRAQARLKAISEDANKAVETATLLYNGAKTAQTLCVVAGATVVTVGTGGVGGLALGALAGTGLGGLSSGVERSVEVASGDKSAGDGLRDLGHDMLGHARTAGTTAIAAGTGMGVAKALSGVGGAARLATVARGAAAGTSGAATSSLQNDGIDLVTGAEHLAGLSAAEKAQYVAKNAGFAAAAGLLGGSAGASSSLARQSMQQGGLRAVASRSGVVAAEIGADGVAAVGLASVQARVEGRDFSSEDAMQSFVHAAFGTILGEASAHVRGAPGGLRTVSEGGRQTKAPPASRSESLQAEVRQGHIERPAMSRTESLQAEVRQGLLELPADRVIRIGRADPANDLNLLSGTEVDLTLGKVSRSHLEVRLDSTTGDYMVRDTGSANGTSLVRQSGDVELTRGEWTRVEAGSRLNLGRGFEFDLPTPAERVAYSFKNVQPDQYREAVLRGDIETPFQRTDFRHDGPVPKENMRFIAANRLEPTDQLVLENARIAVSDVFKILSRPEAGQPGRNAVLASVEIDGQKSLRVFYQSDSQGTWRVLPAADIYENKIGHFDKMDNELRLDLPPEIQRRLAQKVLIDGPRQDIPPDTADFILRGAIKNTESGSRYDWLNTPEVARNFPEFGRQVDRSAFVQKLETDVPKELWTAYGIYKAYPHKVNVPDPAKAPDFGARPDRFSHRTGTAGDVEALVYPSRDGSIDYTFYRDREGKVWIGSVSPSGAELNSFGVPVRSLQAMDLVTPRWEYDQITPPQYGGKSHPTLTHYTDNWNYLREIPVIREFYTSRGLRVPPPVPRHNE